MVTRHDTPSRQAHVSFWAREPRWPPTSHHNAENRQAVRTRPECKRIVVRRHHQVRSRFFLPQESRREMNRVERAELRRHRSVARLDSGRPSQSRRLLANQSVPGWSPRCFATSASESFVLSLRRSSVRRLSVVISALETPRLMLDEKPTRVARLSAR